MSSFVWMQSDISISLYTHDYPPVEDNFFSFRVLSEVLILLSGELDLSSTGRYSHKHSNFFFSRVFDI
jgi:hypothetical protein